MATGAISSGYDAAVTIATGRSAVGRQSMVSALCRLINTPGRGGVTALAVNNLDNGGVTGHTIVELRIGSANRIMVS